MLQLVLVLIVALLVDAIAPSDESISLLEPCVYGYSVVSAANALVTVNIAERPFSASVKLQPYFLFRLQ